MPEQTKSAEASAATAEKSPNGWVREMHDYFQATGSYRAEDVARVLGNPGERVEIKAGSESSSNTVSTHTGG